MNEREYIFKTTDYHEAALMLHSKELASALYDILDWYRAIYNYKDYDGSVLLDGEILSKNDYLKQSLKDGSMEEDNSVYLYTYDDLCRKLENLTEDVRDIVGSHYV